MLLSNNMFFSFHFTADKVCESVCVCHCTLPHVVYISYSVCYFRSSVSSIHTQTRYSFILCMNKFCHIVKRISNEIFLNTSAFLSRSLYRYFTPFLSCSLVPSSIKWLIKSINGTKSFPILFFLLRLLSNRNFFADDNNQN